MRRISLRILVALVLASAAILACTAAAYAAPSTSLFTSVNSTGNAGGWFGNLSYGTQQVYWYNQDISIVATPTLNDGASTGNITLRYFAYSFNSSAFTSITADYRRTFSAEGKYSFDATGSDTADVAFEGTRTLGIDKTRPVSSSDAVPVYDASATIVLKGTDALSGPEWVLYSLDGASDFATTAPTFTPTATVTASVVSKTAGMHTLSWFTSDNAGNFEHAHTISFQINAAGYTPVLGKPTASVRKKTVTFKGTVTAATSNMTVKLTVQRKVGKKFKAFTTYNVTASKYASAYATAKAFKKKGTFRVMATEGTGSSAWSKNFVVK